jgi:alpha-1,4-N-acetylglucosaminyltransferase EXTL3
MAILDPFFKMKLSRLLITIVVLLIAVPVITHFFLSRVDSVTSQRVNLDNLEPETARNKLKLLDLDGLSASQLKERIDDLLRIKHSVLTELRYIEQDRAEKLKQKSEMDRLINRLKAEATREQSELEKLRVSISQARMLQKELAERNNPEILPPVRVLSGPENNFNATKPEGNDAAGCTMGRCFDFVRCPLSSGFPVYFYGSSEYSWVLDGNGFGYRSVDPESACLYVAVVDFGVENDFINKLECWRGDGRNHILIDSSIDKSNVVKTSKNEVDVGKAIVASSSFFERRKFRRRFDLSLPTFSLRDPSTG